MSASTGDFAETAQNPFTPVFGRVPAYLAGRERIIDSMIDVFDKPLNNPNTCTLFVGARGTGKTALLTFLGSQAQQRGWITANVTAQEGMLEDILERLEESAAHLITSSRSHRLSGVQIAGIGSLRWDNKEQQLGNWRTRMNTLFAQLEPLDVGVVITVDEVSLEAPEMEQLAITFQHFVREGKKCVLLMAGLPYQVSALLSGKSTSFLRRAARFNLSSIAPYEAKEAFRLTVESGGRTIGESAIDEAVCSIGGFPFMFQLVGYRAWNAAAGQREISLQNVIDGANLAREELESRIFDATLAELSKADILFLEAMAQDDAETTREDLMSRLGKGSGHVSTYKKRLMESGVIEEPIPGHFRFLLPGFGDYLKQRLSI